MKIGDCGTKCRAVSENDPRGVIFLILIFFFICMLSFLPTFSVSILIIIYKQNNNLLSLFLLVYKFALIICFDFKCC